MEADGTKGNGGGRCETGMDVCERVAPEAVQPCRSAVAFLPAVLECSAVTCLLCPAAQRSPACCALPRSAVACLLCPAAQRLPACSSNHALLHYYPRRASRRPFTDTIGAAVRSPCEGVAVCDAAVQGSVSQCDGGPCLPALQSQSRQETWRLRDRRPGSPCCCHCSASAGMGRTM